MRERHIVLTAALLAVVLSGCGGSGGSSAGSPGSPATTSEPAVTISWPARSRDVLGPMSALSATIILRAASPSGVDVSLTVNRPASSAAARQSYAMTSPVKPGVRALAVVFYSSANGGGSEVADASAGVAISQAGAVLSPNGTPLGPIVFTSTISSVSILPGQVFPRGVAEVPSVSAQSADGSVVAFSPGSATFQVSNNTGSAQVLSGGGAIQGLTVGNVIVTATVDGQTSPPQAVTFQISTTTNLTPRLLNQPTRHLVLNPNTGTIWASVPGSAAKYGNCVIEIDPTDGTVKSSVFVGNEPDVLALSDDGSTLYVGQDATYAMCPVNAVSHTAGKPFALVPSISPNVRVADMAVQPGKPNVVALTIQDETDSGFSGPQIYDSGQMRANSLGIYQGFFVAFASPSLLWTDTEGEPTALNKIRVDATGATQIGTGETGLGINGFVRIFGNRIYGAGGTVWDDSTGLPVGTLPVAAGVSHPQDAPFGDTVTVDLAANRAFVVEVLSGTTLQLGVFDTASYLPVAVGLLPASLTVSDTTSECQGTDVLRWGPKGLAFRTATEVAFVDQAPGL